MICGIYRLTSPSGKSYIGQSINVKGRFTQYKRLDCKDQPKLYNALKKYGPTSFKYEILEECSRGVLYKKEKRYIKEYDAIKNGYNCREAGFVPLMPYTGTQNIEFYIDGVLYKSIKEASNQLSIPPKTIHNRLNSKNIIFSNYRYKDPNLIPKRRQRLRNNKEFYINDVLFSTLEAASRQLHIPVITIYHRLKSPTVRFSNYQYTKPQPLP